MILNLFKRVLLSLFPDEMMTGDNMNPASMFVSFISTKEFFSVINRRIVENYKINFFDVALDSFELKVWFGDISPLKKKQVDSYYSYCALANINGYRFFALSNLANSLTLVASLYVKDVFSGKDNQYLLSFFFTIYLSLFVFVSKIKTFPIGSRNESYNWFVWVFFDLYWVMCKNTFKNYDPIILEEIKKDILASSDIFFVIFEMVYHIKDFFVTDKNLTEDFYHWMFSDELKNPLDRKVINDFIKNKDSLICAPRFTKFDRSMVQYVLPSDMLLKYLFADMDIPLVVDTIIFKVYDKKKLDEMLMGFRKGTWNIEDFIMYVSDYKQFKNDFFAGVKQYVMKVFQHEKESIDPEEMIQDLDEMVSGIGDDLENLKNFKVPERVKKESKIMEKVFNFYVTWVGWFNIGRGDSLYLRMFKKPLLDKCIQAINNDHLKIFDTAYWGSWYYMYSKNTYYYRNILENVKKGKQKFMVNQKAKNISVASSDYMTQLFKENFMSNLLQDINPKEIKLYIKNKQILQVFRDTFWSHISSLIKQKDGDFVSNVYAKLIKLLWINSEDLFSSLDKWNIFSLKESLYNLDFWMMDVVLSEIGSMKILHQHYNTSSLLGIMSVLRETLFGFLLYVVFLENKQKGMKKWENLRIDILYTTYVIDVLWIEKSLVYPVQNVIQRIKMQFANILELWIQLDDNQEFFELALQNWQQFTKNSAMPYSNVSGEDILWFRWFLKNIAYYNKRFLIPQA